MTSDLNPIFHVNTISAGRRNTRQSVHDLVRAGLVWTGAQHSALASTPTRAIQARLGRLPGCVPPSMSERTLAEWRIVPGAHPLSPTTER